MVQSGSSERRWRLSTPGWIRLLAVVAIFIVLRIPSLVEPPTYNDEGTYSDIGWALDHGAVLYRDVWGHYTPGVYWLSAAINLVNTSVFAFHLVLAIALALTALGIWLFCRRLASTPVAWAAALGFVILSSLPTLEGDSLYVEVIGAMCVVGAVLLIARPGRVTKGAAIAAGVAAAAAILCKPTFAADAVAVATIPAVIAVASGRRPGGPELRALLLVAGGGCALLGIAAVALGVGGSLPGLLDVLTHQDVSYLQSANGGGASGSGSGSGSTSVLLLMTVIRIGVVLVVGAIVTWKLARGRHLAGAVASWWLTWGVAAVVLSAYGYPHYAAQMEPALCIAAALLASRLVRSVPLRHAVMVVVTTVVAWVVCVGVIIAPTAAASIVTPQNLSSFVTSVVSPHVITHYFADGWEHVLGLITPAKYEAGFGSEPSIVRATVDIIDAHSRSGDRVFVWGRAPWVYSLSSRLPAGRYTSLNSSYTLDPQAQHLLLSELRAHPPAVMVELEPLPVAVTAFLKTLQYEEVLPTAGGETYWLAADRS